MVTCKQCGTDLSSNQVIHGVSKKNGKPYKMVKCSCGNAEFLPFGVAEKKPVAVSTPAPTQGTSAPQSTKILMDIYGEITKANGKLIELEKIVRTLGQKLEAKEVSEQFGGGVTEPADITWGE